MTGNPDRTTKFVVLGGALTLLLGFSSPAQTQDREPMPIDPLWKSEGFRKAFTASYGIDSRIEPKVTTEEKAVLDAVASEMASEDRDGAAAKLTGSSLLSKSAALIFALGNIRFEQGKVEDAIENFNKAIELYPNFRDAHRNLAVAEVQRGKFTTAEPHLRRALELGARDGVTLGLLGYCHASEGRFQAALQSYRLAQLTMPDEVQWKIGEAGALLALEDLQAASSIYEGVLESQPGNFSIWMNLADIRLRQGENTEAIANLEVARRLGGLDAPELLSLGHLYLNESLLPPALSCYREGLTATPPAPFTKAVDTAENLTRFRLWNEAQGIAVEIANNENYAVALSDDSEPDEKDRRRLQRVRALIELEIGELETGAEMVAELVESDPLDGEALLLLARFKAREKKTEEAEMLLEQAAQVPEFEAEALRELGGSLAQRGEFEAALKALNRSYELAPDVFLGEYIDTVENLAQN